jgi:hypothetical protein
VSDAVDDRWPTDAHRLRPGDLPTPFSAAEIRDASVPGLTIRSLIERQGAEPVIRVVRFDARDADGGFGDSWTEAPDGARLTEPERHHSTWLELQGHASMPAQRTTIDEETFEIPAGRFEGWRYARTDGEKVDTFWFAKSMPGAPLRYETRVGGEVVFRSTAVEIRTE